MTILLGFLAGAASFVLLGLFSFGLDDEAYGCPDALGLEGGVGMSDRRPPERRVRQRRIRLQPAMAVDVALFSDSLGEAVLVEAAVVESDS